MDQEYYGDLSLDDTEFFPRDRSKRVVVIQPIKFEKVGWLSFMFSCPLHE